VTDIVEKFEIESSEKSREGQFLIVSVAASLRRTSMKVCDRFRVYVVLTSLRVGRASDAEKLRFANQKRLFQQYLGR
jgi:hypothetical protein